MVRFTIFSGHEGQLGPDGDFYVTIFAGSHLRRPPLTAWAVRTRRLPNAEHLLAQYTFFTLFGGVKLQWPTLADEYIALRDALRSGALTLDEWDQFVARHGRVGGLAVNAITLFGGCDGDAVPSENAELDELALHRQLGHIPDAAVQHLLSAVEQKGVFRLAAVRQAVAASGQ